MESEDLEQAHGPSVGISPQVAPASGCHVRALSAHAILWVFKTKIRNSHFYIISQFLHIENEFIFRKTDSVDQTEQNKGHQFDSSSLDSLRD